MSAPESIGEEVSWSLPGIAQTPIRTATLVTLVPLTSLAGLAFTRQPFFMLLGPLFLAPVLTRYFLKPTYRLTAENARASWGTGQTEILWTNVLTVLPFEGGLRLSPVKEGDRREAFRGVELRLPEDEALSMKIRTRIREHLPDEVQFDPAV